MTYKAVVPICVCLLLAAACSRRTLDSPWRFDKKTVTVTNAKLVEPEDQQAKDETAESKPTHTDAEAKQQLPRPLSKPPVRLEDPFVQEFTASLAKPNEKVKLEFDALDIRAFIDTCANLFGFNYLLAPDIPSTTVTISMKRELAVKDVVAVFCNILQANGIAMVRVTDGFYRFTPAGNVDFSAARVDGSGMAIKVIDKTRYPAADLAQYLKPFVSKNIGQIIDVADVGVLLVLDASSNINHLQQALTILDSKGPAVLFLDVRYRPLEEVKELLEKIFAPDALGRGAASLRFTSLDSLSKLMVSNAPRAVAAEIERWLQVVDQPADDYPRTFIYYCLNKDPDVLAEILNKIFSAMPEAGAYAAPQPDEKESPGGQDFFSMNITNLDSAKIMADKGSKTLIIHTTQRTYHVIHDTLNKLDTIPKQVLIEVMIAEVLLDESLTYGLEWVLRGYGTGNLEGTVGTAGSNFDLGLNFPGGNKGSAFTPKHAGSFGYGFNYLLGRTNQFLAKLAALASESKLNVLSSPLVLVSDNEEANISITDQIQVDASIITDPSGGRTVAKQFHEAGIKLNVIPHISENRLVNLKIKQEVSEVKSVDPPEFFSRDAETSMIVADGQTLIIGGLISETTSFQNESLPLIHRIPLLRDIFGKTSRQKNRTELIFLVTPHVIGTIEEGADITESIRGSYDKLLQ